MRTFESNLQSLVWPVLFFIAGISASSYDLVKYLDPVPTPFLIASILGVAFFVLLTKISYYQCVHHFCLLLFFMAGWCITTFQEIAYEWYSIEIYEEPSPRGIITDISKYAGMDRLGVQVRKKFWWSPGHHFNINLLDRESSFREGQTIRIDKPLNPIQSDYIPFSFDAKSYWKLKNTSHDVFLYNASGIELIKDQPKGFIDIIRQKGLNRIDSLYPDPALSGVLKALILGQTDGVTKEVKSHFKNSGLLHVLAVSGLHVGIVSGLLFFLLFPVKIFYPQPWLHYLMIICALWGYALVTGMNIPVVRAVILMTFYLTATRLNRQRSKWNIYFWALMIVLIMQPKSLFSVSFQLSFGAVAAILIFYNPINLWLKSKMGQHYFTSLIAVSLAAQIGVLPLLLWHFQQISLVSTLSSLLVIPLLFPLILFTTFAIIAPVSWDWLVWVMQKISQTIANLLLGLSDMLASWEFSSRIIVWHPITIFCLILAILIAGLYLETGGSNYRSWFKYSSMTLLGLGIIAECGNIYFKRTHPVLVIFEFKDQPVSELYFQGKSYSNYKESPPPFLQRIRKKYYTRETIPTDTGPEWTGLIAALRNSIMESENQRSQSIRIFNCIQKEVVEVPFDSFDEITFGFPHSIQNLPVSSYYQIE